MLISDGKAALFHHDAQQRALAACIGASIALHALALFSFPGLRLSTQAGNSTALTATFSPRPQSPETAQAATPKPPEPPQREEKPEPPRPVLAQSAPADPDVPQPVAPASVPVPSQPAQTASSASAPLASATEPQASATSDTADPGLLERYRLALIDAAKRYRRYPVQAMERGWQGRVEIRVAIGANGTIKDTLIKTSSNHQILDDQALDMVKRSEPLTPVPAALRGREFTVDVPVIFELQTG
jgi:protein TonB